MDKQREKLKEIIEESVLTGETKEKAFQLLSNKKKKINEIKQEVMLLISTEIDGDIEQIDDAVGPTEEDLLEAEAEFEEELSAIETELEADLLLVEDNPDYSDEDIEEEQKQEELMSSLNS